MCSWLLVCSLLHIYIVPIYVNASIIMFCADPIYLFVNELTAKALDPISISYMSLLSCLDLTHVGLNIRMLSVIIFNFIYVYWSINIHTIMLIGLISCVLMPIIMNLGASHNCQLAFISYICLGIHMCQVECYFLLPCICQHTPGCFYALQHIHSFDLCPCPCVYQCLYRSGLFRLQCYLCYN